MTRNNHRKRRIYLTYRQKKAVISERKKNSKTVYSEALPLIFTVLLLF